MFVLSICSDLPRNVGGFSFTSKAPEKRLLFQFVNHPPDHHQHGNDNGGHSEAA